MRLIYESDDSDAWKECFDIYKEGGAYANYASEFIGNKMVGNVTIHDYKKFTKGQDSNIEYMTADEYIERCADDIFDMTVEQTMSPVDWGNVRKYAKLMKEGNKFSIPYLDLVYKQQEGRHRVLAFKELYGENAVLPVLVITPSDPTLDEIHQYVKNRWGSVGEWHVRDSFINMARAYEFDDKKIYKYLGEDPPEEQEEEPEEENDEENEDFEVTDDDIADYLDDEYDWSDEDED